VATAPDNNLFANGIVAVDARTGKYSRYFPRTVHHDVVPACTGQQDRLDVHRRLRERHAQSAASTSARFE